MRLMAGVKALFSFMVKVVERPGLWPGSFRGGEFDVVGLEARRCWLVPIVVSAYFFKNRSVNYLILKIQIQTTGPGEPG